MNFQEAESRFRWLSDELAAGRISEAQYRAGLNEIRVTDERGGLWMMQERTGQWHLYNGSQWIPASPPRPAAPAPPPPPQPAAMPAPPVAQTSGGGCGKTAVYLVGWAVVFAAIAAAVAYFAEENRGAALLLVGAVALFSLISMLSSLRSQWQGQIIDIHQESYRRKSGNRWITEHRTVAVVREPGGKTRKVGAARDWRVGDYLEKRQGDTSIRKR